MEASEVGGAPPRVAASIAASDRVRLDHRLGTGEVFALAGFDRPAHASHRVLAQQLQDPGEPAGAGRRAVVGFQSAAELGEAGRQLPVAEDRRVIQRARACGPGPPGNGVGSRIMADLAKHRGCVATTWPPATITTRST